MPFLIRKIEVKIVEQNSSVISSVNKIDINVGYGGYYFTVSNFICIIQNFDSVINSSELTKPNLYGVKNNKYSEFKINY